MREDNCKRCGFEYYVWQIGEDGICEYCYEELVGSDAVLTRLLGREHGLKRGEVVEKLYRIGEMSDEEVKINAEWIRKIARSGASLLKQQPRMVQEQARKITNQRSRRGNHGK